MNRRLLLFCTIVSMETDHSKCVCVFYLCVCVCVHVSRLTIRLDEFIFLFKISKEKTKKKTTTIQGFIIFKCLIEFYWVAGVDMGPEIFQVRMLLSSEVGLY